MRTLRPLSRHRDDDPLEFTFLDCRLAFVPHYTAAPTQYLPVYRIDPERGRELVPLKWGWIPSWAKDLSLRAKMINARSESAHRKPVIPSAYKHM